MKVKEINEDIVYIVFFKLMIFINLGLVEIYDFLDIGNIKNLENIF